MLRKFTVSTLSPKIAQMCEVYWAMKRRICNWTMGDSWCWPLPNVLNRLYSHTWNDMITGMSLTWTDYSFHSGRWRRLSIWIFSFQFWFFLSTTSFLLGTWCIFCISENHSPLLWLWNGNKQSEVEEICCQQLSKLILYFFFFLAQQDSAHSVLLCTWDFFHCETADWRTQQKGAGYTKVRKEVRKLNSLNVRGKKYTPHKISFLHCAWLAYYWVQPTPLFTLLNFNYNVLLCVAPFIAKGN